VVTWTAPSVTRVDEPFIADERDILEGFLDWYRATLLHKCAGLTPEQLALRPIPSSSLSLLGLVRHMTGVERGWLRRRFAREQIDRPYNTDERPDADFDDAVAENAETDFAAYQNELGPARAATAGHALTETLERSGREISLRWTYVHMIEEYARHCGHADLIRELIDGKTGS
jgi:uncharacterized damage-inducible protein DinB